MKMKKFIPLFIGLLVLSLAGCKEDSFVGLSYICEKSKEDYQDWWRLVFNADGTCNLDSPKNYNHYHFTHFKFNKRSREFIFCTDDGEEFGPFRLSKDMKSLTSYYGDIYTQENPDDKKVTFKSVEVGGINFQSSPADIVVRYPDCRIVENEDGGKSYVIWELDGFQYDYISFDFKNNMPYRIEKYKIEEDKDEGTVAVAQREVQVLTEKYGIPKIDETSVYSASIKTTKHSREYYWWGDGIKICVDYEWNSYDDRSKPDNWRECTINYETY